MTTHELKTWPQYFDAIVRGIKTLEVRKFDRNFAAGDRLRLREWDPTTGHYTGNEELRDVSYLMSGGPWMKDGMCAMAIKPISAPTAALNETQKAVDARMGLSAPGPKVPLASTIKPAPLQTHVFLCPRCGYALIGDPAKGSLCPHCGKEMALGWAFTKPQSGDLTGTSEPKPPIELDVSLHRYFRRVIAHPNGALVHNGDCRFSDVCICTCGLLDALRIRSEPRALFPQFEAHEMFQSNAIEWLKSRRNAPQSGDLTGTSGPFATKLRAQLDDAQEQIGRLTRIHKALDANVAGLDRALTDAEKRAAAWESATKSVESRHAILDRKLAEARERIAVLEEHDLQWQQNALKIRRALGLSIHSNDSLVDTATNLLNDRDRLRLERTEAYTEHNRLVSEKNKVLAAMDKVTAERDKLRSILERAETCLRSQEKNGSDLASELLEELQPILYPNSPPPSTGPHRLENDDKVTWFRCVPCEYAYPVAHPHASDGNAIILQSRACPKCGRKPRSVS